VLTDTKELERLRGSESLLRLLIDSLPAFISYIDSEQRYVFANALYAAFFGQALNELIGRHVNEILGYEAYQKVRTHIQAALNGQRQSYEYELPHAGKTRHIRAVYVPHMEKGKVKGIFVLGIDITEQKQLEQKLGES
jgi:PAS domain S-box-containing protein